MKCPWPLCDAEIDPADLHFKPGRGMKGKCSKCGRAITLIRKSSGKRLTNSQKRKMKREALK